MKVTRVIKMRESIELNIKEVTLLSIYEVEYVPKDSLNLNKAWWLLSPGNTSIKATFVGGSGLVNTIGFIINSEFGVRPVLIIEDSVDIGAEFEIAGYDWTAISDNMLLCDEIVGYSIFDNNCNKYEDSFIKQWLEEWAADKGII